MDNESTQARWAPLKRVGLAAADWGLRLHPRLLRRASRLQALATTAPAPTCVILGNGPSLADTDFDLLRGTPVWVVNNCTALLRDGLVDPSFYVAQDRLFLKRHAALLRRLDRRGTQLFLPRKAVARRPDLLRLQHAHFFDQTGTPGNNLEGLQGDVVAGVPHAIPRLFTVMTTAMLLASHIGFTRLVLLGMDLDWTGQPDDPLVRRRGMVRVYRARGGTDRDHFDPTYRTAGDTYYVVPPEAHVESVRAIVPSLSTHGVEVINATPTDRLGLFPAAPLDQALRDAR